MASRLQEIIGTIVKGRVLQERSGDQRHTFADTAKMRRLLWEPAVNLVEGLSAQVRRQRDEFRAEERK